jgi:predicted Rossmann fold nucleotide-binding protein DprA/Smf involved in DNA uptake
LVTGPGDILDCLGEAGQTLKAALQPEDEPTQEAHLDQPNLTDTAAKVYQAMTTEPEYVDVLCRQTGMEIGAIQASLMQLRLTGLIEKLPGNQVRRIR